MPAWLDISEGELSEHHACRIVSQILHDDGMHSCLFADPAGGGPA